MMENNKSCGKIYNSSGRRVVTSRSRGQDTGSSGRKCSDHGQGAIQGTPGTWHGIIIPNRVFVGGVIDDITDEQLTELFQKYGEVTEAKIIRDPKTSASRGYAFVSFADEKDVKNLTNQGSSLNLSINGRRLNINHAYKKANTFGRSFGNMYNNSGNNNGSPIYQAMPSWPVGQYPNSQAPGMNSPSYNGAYIPSFNTNQNGGMNYPLYYQNAQPMMQGVKNYGPTPYQLSYGHQVSHPTQQYDLYQNGNVMYQPGQINNCASPYETPSQSQSLQMYQGGMVNYQGYSENTKKVRNPYSPIPNYNGNVLQDNMPNVVPNRVNQLKQRNTSGGFYYGSNGIQDQIGSRNIESASPTHATQVL